MTIFLFKLFALDNIFNFQQEAVMQEVITITRGINGYPQQLYEATTFDSLPGLKEFAVHERKDIQLYRKRDGWGLYEKVDWFPENDLTEISFPDELNHFVFDLSLDLGKQAHSYFLGEYADIEEYANENGKGNAEEMLTAIKEVVNILEGEKRKGAKKALLLFDVDNRTVQSRLNDIDTFYRDGVWLYQLGVE